MADFSSKCQGICSASLTFFSLRNCLVFQYRKHSAASASHLASPLLLQAQPARADSARDLGGLETAMQSLALDGRSPIALEIAATTTPTAQRSFLLRAAHTVALRHLAAQIQSRYPQAHLTASTADPLQMAPFEECSVVELSPGAASYLPLHAFRAQDLLHEGVDPLLGILAAFTHLPPGARALVQLALVPAPPTWSQNHRRLAVEHPLAQERQREGMQRQTSAPGMGKIVALFVLVVCLVLISRFQRIVLPTWLLQAGITLLHGKMPALSLAHLALLLISAILLFSLLVGGSMLFSRLAARFHQPALYDQRLVAEKTVRPAYQARLRLFVIMPGSAKPLLAGQALTSRHVAVIWLRTLSKSVWGTFRHSRRALALVGTHGWTRLRHVPRHVRPWAATTRTEWRVGWQEWRTWRADMRQYRRDARERAQQRRELLAMLGAAYAQYHLAAGGYFVPTSLSRRHVSRLLASDQRRTLPRLRKRGWSADLRRSRHYLSVADLAALWHLPQAHDLANLSHLAWGTTRTLLAPPAVTTGQGYRLGISTHAGETVPVFFPWSGLRQNMLALASTGKGKSSWLLHLSLALFRARTTGTLRGGLMQIDVHGDLHRQTLSSIPPELEEEVVLIDLAERTRLVGLNPLDVSHGAERDKLVDTIIALIEAIWPNSYGPRTENILEYACKTLVEANLTRVARDPIRGPDEQYTLLDVVPLVRDESFRHAVLEQVHDPFIHAWWDQYFEHNDARQQNEYSSSVVTKFSKFASSHVARRLLGQPRSTLNLAEIIAQEKLLLINCASGEVGADIAAFVGAVLLGLFHVALAEQARLAVTARRRFLVLIDEFQALTGVDYQTMLAELRKYGGSFALATQSLAYLDRLDRTLRATVLANIDHLFAFAMSAEDAALLRLEGVEPEDLVNLPNYTCYARLLLDGQRLPLFSLRLDDPLPQPAEASDEEKQREERCHRIALRSHLRYARPVGEIDALLLSIQAREALLRASPRNKARPSAGGTSPSAPDAAQSRGTPRRTRRRGSGKGSRGSGQPGTGVEGEQEKTTETRVIHELFADPANEGEAPEEHEEPEEHHA
jgi:hypothetical protein